MVTNSRDNLSAFVIAGLEEILSLTFTCEEIQILHLWLPATSGASHDKQQIENPICSMARRGNDIFPRTPCLAMKPTKGNISRKTGFDK